MNFMKTMKVLLQKWLEENSISYSEEIINT